MTLLRRQLLQRAAGAVAFFAAARAASAQSYPTKPVRLIVAFPPGNASDIIARLTAQALSERLGQQIIVENRAGAGGTIGTEAVVKAAPDGYTLLMEVMTSNAINTSLYPALNYDFARDIAPVASIGSGSYTVIVTPSLPARTVPELIAYAKANPGKINMASAGNGTATHVFGELFKLMAGVALVHIPYRSSFIPDLLAGNVHIAFGPISQSIELIRSGKLRALAVTAATRQAALPEVPTVGESVPGYEASSRYGIGAPKNTPAAIIDRLNAEAAAALADPKLKGRLADMGVEAVTMKPGDFGRLVVEETDKWAKVIRAANIKPD